jgi:hypothetical protein
MSVTIVSVASVATERGARYGKQLVSHLGRITPDRQMARGPSPLPHALHPHLLVVAQPGRAMVRANDRQTTTPRRAHLGLRAGKRHPRLDHHLEPEPQTVRLDQDRRRHPRTTRVISSSNSWRSTLGDHDDFRGPGVQRCNRLGTNVIPGTTRYLLGCACGQELVRSVVHNDIDTFAR